MDNVKQGSCVLWTDSKTVLHWISSTHQGYTQFVGNDGGGLKIYEGVTMQMNSIERQLYRVVNLALEAEKKKEFAEAAILDKQQPFDGVWHPNILYTAKMLFLLQLYLVIKSCMENRTFHVTADGFKSSGAPWYIRTKEIKRNLKVPKLRDKLKNISRNTWNGSMYTQ
ncbi:GD19446 [Drosophila simulans]|uniref:GD19446 n=1 Tax=Drosophila simulans TaxID=7240 RepID=B4NVH8_DROSI|nr:GD19446 [Drosophila simulans]